MKKIGILYHPMKEATFVQAQKLEDLLKRKGVSVWGCSAWDVDKARTMTAGTDLLLSVGGDGTILRAAQVALDGCIPITGVNMGHLGFMTEVSVEDAPEKLNLLLKGEGWIDERSLLEAEVSSPEDDGPAGKFFALNDVVVARGEIPRVIHIDASIDDIPLTTYKADGVIVATATGSTGYALSAGGPILHPQAKETVILPLVPHLSLAHPLILPPSAVIRLRSRSFHSVTLSIDGHLNMIIANETVTTIRRSASTVRFLRLNAGTSFYSSLEKRLKGKN